MTADLRDRMQEKLAGAYTLGRELGGGGMSHVFVAEDNALGRTVVVKVLRPELAEGLSAERFQREIRLAARLQHPHIVPLLAAGELTHGTGASLLYYSMPLVEGDSLRDRLRREGSLPIAVVIRVLRDVVSALAYAHRQRIVHRDIKPENILLAEGVAVVTDFGIAKAIHAARRDGDGDDGARTSTLTQPGTSLGTPAYMAPEQATGDAVDHRTDLYALGVVAYETLAGRPPFDGRTAPQLIAAHAAEAPEPIERRRHTAPPALGALVMRLLEKAPADRPQTADEVLRTLDAIAADVDSANASALVIARSRTAGRRGGWRERAGDPLVIGLTVATVAAMSALAWTLLARRDATPPPQPRARFTLELPADAGLNTDGPGGSFALSPDGSHLAYVGGTPARLFVRHLDSLTSRPLAGTEQANNPVFSPDGRWIGFATRTGVAKVPADGGPVTRIATGGARFAWTPDGTIVFTRSAGGFLGGLWRVSADGGTPEEITATHSALRDIHGSPIVLPDGKTVLFTTVSVNGNVTLAAVRLGDRRVVPLGLAGAGATYLAGGYLLFGRGDGSVAAVRFDPERLRVIGEPVKVLDGVATKTGVLPQLSVASNGTMVYLPGIIGTQLVAIDRRGSARVLVPTVQVYSNPRVSPDGRRIAVSIGHPPYTSDIWVYEVGSGTLTRLTTDGTSDGPEWTPDGRRIAWTSVSQGRVGIWWQPWDAGTPPELVVPGGREARFTPGGEAVLVNFEAPNGTEVRMIPLPFDSARPGTVVLPPAPGYRHYRVSPDGRWLAYLSDETGLGEVYVQPFPGPGRRSQISVGGGIAPVWAPSGKELFYVSTGCCMISAKIASTPDLTVIRRDTLFPVRGASHPVLTGRTAYDLTPDGNHFIMARLIENTGRPIVVFGWPDEVRARVAAGGR